MDLEEITADAKACAENVWWRAHDEGNYDLAAGQFATAENIISKYSGNKPDLDKTAECFSAALQAYDKFTEKLKGRNGTKGLETDLGAALVRVYNALGINPSVAEHNALWWLHFAHLRLADKKGHVIDYYLNYARLSDNLADEHKVRYDFGNDNAHGLASLMLAASHFGDNARPKNWEKVKGYMESYYREMFTILAERKKEKN